MFDSRLLAEDSDEKLWNKNYVLILFSNILLYAAVYMLFPVLHDWLSIDWLLMNMSASLVVVTFGFAMFLPGALINYMVDTFKRKSVCTHSMFLMALTGLLYPFVSQVWMVVALRIVQGALFGVVLMTMGSTLVIDVTPHHNRNYANFGFAFSGVLGSLIGLCIGFWDDFNWPLEYYLYLSGFIILCSIFSLSMVKVSFRAPLELPFLSFDRFILFRDIIPGLNMMIVPLVLGMIIGVSYDSFFYICALAGFLLFILVGKHLARRVDGRIMVVLGLLLILGGMYLLSFSHGDIYNYSAGVMIGFGTGVSMARFLRIMVMVPRHCERGTGYNTYQLMWELGIMLGICVGHHYYKTTIRDPHSIVTLLVLIGILVYVLVIHPLFIRKMKERE